MRSSVRWMAILALVLMVQSAFAGGWATVSVDELPNDVKAGETITIGFMVRQHGERPAEGLTPRLLATHVESGETLTINAVEKGVVGHYEVSMAFPKSGTWTWQIAPDPFPIVDEKAVVTLNVLPAPVVEAAPASTTAPSPATASSGRWLIGGGVLVVALIASLIVLRRPQRKTVSQTQ